MCNTEPNLGMPSLKMLPKNNYDKSLYSLFSVPVMLCIIVVYMRIIYKKIIKLLNTSQESVCDEYTCNNCVESVCVESV